MWSQTSHLSDEELLLWMDGELPRRRAAKARVHLSACWDCRSRLARIETAIHEFMHAHHASTPRLPSIAGPRALLTARLTELSMGKGIPDRAKRRVPRGWAAAACLPLIIMGGVLLHYRTRGLKQETDPNALSLPDPHLTPGATMTVDINDLCSKPHDEVVRSVPIALQETVLREYGLPPSREQNFEIDFLISPGLGGAETIRNLWPEPRYHTMWNSFVKDQLEDYLHQSVCAGRVSLQTAQRDIAVDWVSAYQKYFHTKKPLAAVSGVSRTSASVFAVFPQLRGFATLETAHRGKLPVNLTRFAVAGHGEVGDKIPGAPL